MAVKQNCLTKLLLFLNEILHVKNIPVSLKKEFLITPKVSKYPVFYGPDSPHTDSQFKAAAKSLKRDSFEPLQNGFFDPVFRKEAIFDLPPVVIIRTEERGIRLFCSIATAIMETVYRNMRFPLE